MCHVKANKHRDNANYLWKRELKMSKASNKKDFK